MLDDYHQQWAEGSNIRWWMAIACDRDLRRADPSGFLIGPVRPARTSYEGPLPPRSSGCARPGSAWRRVENRRFGGEGRWASLIWPTASARCASDKPVLGFGSQNTPSRLFAFSLLRPTVSCPPHRRGGSTAVVGECMPNSAASSIRTAVRVTPLIHCGRQQKVDGNPYEPLPGRGAR